MVRIRLSRALWWRLLNSQLYNSWRSNWLALTTAERRLRVVDQVAQQPQVQGMHLGNIALGGQVVGAGAVAVIECIEALVGQRLLALDAGQARAHEAVEAVAAGLRQQITVDRGQADRRGMQAVEEGFQARLGVFLLVFLPELEQERGAFAVGELRQVFLARSEEHTSELQS